MKRFENKVAVIAGASNGIGRATADLMAAEGAIVYLVARDAKRLDEAVSSITTAGGRAFAVAGDATDPETAARATERVERDWGRVDILVNAVGGSTVIARPAGGVDEISHADWQKVIAFNLDAMFHFCHAVVPVMKRERSGKIVNIGSIAGRGAGSMSGCAYAAAKAGIIGFTKNLSNDLGPWNINVNATAPSLTLTDRMKPSWDRFSETEQASKLKQIPLRRVGTAVDQAKVVCFLGSGDSDFVTGLTIDVTGGQF